MDLVDHRSHSAEDVDGDDEVEFAGPACSMRPMQERRPRVEPASRRVSRREARMREELARRYAHRVGFFANKVQRSFMIGSRFSDELESAGYWGLFKALENRRPGAHERELSAYVSQRIHGAVIDAARNCINQVMIREQSGGPVPHDADAATFNESALFDDGEPGAGGRAPAREWGAFADLAVSRDPEQRAMESWKADVVSAALQGLEDDDRRVVRAYMEGSSITEIARDEGVALATMQGRFRRLTRRLRARAPELRRVLLDCEDA